MFDAPPAEAPATPGKPVSWEDIIAGGSAGAQKAAEKAASAALKSPLSWMDVIGGAESPFGANMVSEQRGEQPRVTPPVTEDAALPPFMQSGPLPPVEPPVKGEKTVSSPLNWADVIGAGESSSEEKK